MRKVSLYSLIGGAIGFSIAFLVFAPAARAQTGPELLVKPWPDKGQVSEGSAGAYLFESGHSTPSGDSLRLEEYESVGRFRILPGNEISPRIGYDIQFFDNHTTSPGVPKQLSDESVALGTGIFKYQDWVGGITVGVGYAGDRAFAEGTGWYGKFDLIVARKINAYDDLVFVLDYDGHRNYFPDLPLPGIAFSHRFDPQLSAVIGAPYSSVDWKPLPHLDVNGEYRLYTDLKVGVSYEFLKGWSAFGTYGFIRDAFEIGDLPKDRRLLFYQRRAEVGLQFSPIANFTLKVALGYGWDGSYRSGFDFNQSSLIANVSDEPYLRGGLEWKF